MNSGKYIFSQITDFLPRDQTVRFTTNGNIINYPADITRIVYYEPELKRTFTYYSKNFSLKARNIAFLYKNRWAVETFFKWMKGHLRIRSFWGNTENGFVYRFTLLSSPIAQWQ